MLSTTPRGALDGAIRPALGMLRAAGGAELPSNHLDESRLLLRIGAVETHFSTTVQAGKGPARSWWQIEPATAIDVIRRLELHRRWSGLVPVVLQLLHLPQVRVSGEAWSLALAHHQVGAAALARLIILSWPEEIPPYRDVRAGGELWKLRWNTPLGKGTVAKFIAADSWLAERFEDWP